MAVLLFYNWRLYALLCTGTGVTINYNIITAPLLVPTILPGPAIAPTGGGQSVTPSNGFSSASAETDFDLEFVREAANMSRSGMIVLSSLISSVLASRISWPISP